MLSKAELREMIDKAYVDKLLRFSDIDILIATRGQKKIELKTLVVHDFLLLEWLEEIINKEVLNSWSKDKGT